MLGKLAIFGVVVLLFAAGAHAETIKEKAQVCAGCHGENGKPVDKTIPTIWGQQAGYLYIQLRDLSAATARTRSCNRSHPQWNATTCWR